MATKALVKPARVSAEQELAIAELPSKLHAPVKLAIRDPQMNEGIKEMMGRASEFPSPTAALLAGIGMVPEARSHLDEHIAKLWLKKPPASSVEIVIGAGLSAAVYCAVRVSKGFPAPLVLEGTSRVGGSFAVSNGPSFYLNSRNRPGELSVPGEYDGSLNHLPCAPVQAADLSGEEYQTNDLIAWVIRVTLAMNARVVTDFPVEVVLQRGTVVGQKGLGKISSARVLVGSGLGKANKLAEPSENVLNFDQFMRRMDSPFPLRGMRRVAVVGAGDGGKTAIEALTGLGPQPRMSVASLDRPETIDWFGVQQKTKADWVRCNRSRYTRIGSLFDAGRIEGKGTASVIEPGYNCVYVNGIPYDVMIDCSGYRRNYDIIDDAPLDYYPTNNSFSTPIRRLCLKTNQDVFLIGVSANLDLTADEMSLLKGVSENGTSAWRYSSRTAQLAASLS